MEDIRQIAGALGADSELLLIDTRNDPAVLSLFFFRPWVQGGFRRKQLAVVLPDKPREVLNHFLANGTPRAIVVRAGTDWSGFAEELAAEELQPRVRQIIEREDLLYLDGACIERVPVDPTSSTSIEIAGATTRSFRASDLPRGLRFHLPAPESPHNLLKISASSHYQRNGTALPEPVWIRLAGAGSLDGTLTIDIDPHFSQDAWSFKVEPATIRCHLVASPNWRQRLERLALIVDRTCPDWNHWGEALAIVQGTHAEPGRFGTLNAEIREGLKAALREAKLESEVQCLLAWFADKPAGDFTPLERVPTLAKAWGVTGEFPQHDVPGYVENLTYFPGLDVWDPVEEALSETIPFFRSSGGGTVIIIGNSPPSFPLEKNALRDISRTFGYDTMYRHSSNKWQEGVDELKSLGVKVYYAFLRLGAVGPGQEADFGLLEALQQNVERALRECLPGAVYGGTADANGVKVLMLRILGYAAAEASTSEVELFV